MIRKIIRYTLRTLAILFGTVVLLLVAMYLPPVQDFIKDKAVAYVSEHFGMRLTVERLRLKFPLRLAIDDAQSVTAAGDTLFTCGSLRADVALLPLLRKEVIVRKFTFRDATFHLADTTGGIDLRVRVKEFALEADNVDLRAQTAHIPAIRLSGGHVRLALSPTKADTTAKDTASVPLLWKIVADRLTLDDIAFTLHTSPQASDLTAQITAGRIDSCAVALSDMTVTAARVALRDGRFGYSGGGFGLGLERINLTVDSVFNRLATVRAAITELTFAERSGLAVTKAQGRVAMDSIGYALHDFILQTAASAIRADVNVGAGIASLDPLTPVRADLAATIAPSDLFALAPPSPALRRGLGGQELTLGTRLAGTLGDIDLQNLSVELPRILAFRAAGQVRSVTDPGQIQGQLAISGELRNPAIAAAFLPKEISLPPFRIKGDVKASAGSYSGRIALQAAGGKVALDGSFSPRSQSYRIQTQIDSLPLGRLLRNDSLGFVTLAAQAQGRGFDFFSPKTAARIGIQVKQAEYLRYDYRDITLTADLADSRVDGRLTSDNEALGADLQLSGLLTPQKQEAVIQGDIARLDLEQMHFVKQPATASGRLYAEATATDAGTYAAAVTLDTLKIRYGTFENTVSRTTLAATADTSHVQADIASGDLKLTFLSQAGIDSLAAGFSRAVAEIQAQIWAGRVNTDTLETLLPPFRLDFAAGRSNILNNYLHSQGMGFGRVTLSASAADGQPFGFKAEVNQFSTQGLVLDTLTAGVGGRNGELQYYVRLANQPGNLNRMGMIGLYGHAAGNTGQITLAQKDRSGHKGLDFGLRATLGDSAVTVSLIPQHPVFGFSEWTVNDSNYVRYGFDRRLAADLRVTRAGQSFTLTSAAEEDMPRGSIRLNINGINIANTLSILPAAPPVNGRLGADLLFGMADSTIAARGSVTVDTLLYDGHRVGDIGLNLAYRTDTLSGQQGSLELLIDHQTALKADGRYNPADSAQAVRLTADIPGIPLATANPFLPAGSGSLSGLLKGHFEASGRRDSLPLSGTLRFDSTAVDMAAVGTRFGITDSPIVLAQGKVLFTDFGLIAPNKRRLTVNGSVDLHDLSQMTADLTVKANDFQLVNVPRNKGTMVFGQASADLSAQVRGPLNALDIRGDVSLLTGTEVTYVMQETQAGIQDQSQNVVTFMSFNDTTTVYVARPPAILRLGGIDMLMNVSIDPNVQMAVYLSEDGQNRINLKGGGNLTYSMNRLGDTRFAGKYELSGGQVRYNPPVISAKDFSITPGGYVSWTGEIADPSFSIRATETVRTTVTMEDQTSRQVNFQIIISISGSLESLDIRFDLAAPEDLTLQNQLSSLTAEQRQNQAMGLLIYNTYSGPGTSAKVNTGNPINSFIAKELNQWAQNSLRGVDLSFGVDSYNDAAAGPEGTRTDYSYKLSKKFFDNRIRVIVGGKVSSGGDPGQSAAENLIDDISLEYQLTRRDNMYLKVFRETNFESILEGDVTETGVGFGVRKKVVKLGDLFKLTKEKKEVKAERKAERQASRAEKRQKRQTEKGAAVKAEEPTLQTEN